LAAVRGTGVGFVPVVCAFCFFLFGLFGFFSLAFSLWPFLDFLSVY
jgi:hypothetical protein